MLLVSAYAIKLFKYPVFLIYRDTYAKILYTQNYFLIFKLGCNNYFFRVRRIFYSVGYQVGDNLAYPVFIRVDGARIAKFFN
jgi:hypothetical protein